MVSASRAAGPGVPLRAIGTARQKRRGLLDERSFHTPVGDAQLEMCAALMFALERRNNRLHFVEHCARVRQLVEAMADIVGLADEERADLIAAAQLHEIGMIGVPLRLVETPSRLDDFSIARIRQQATIGAEIVSATCAPRVSVLIEHQYANFGTVRARFGAESKESLLVGLLRAADVADAMLHARPYQASLDASVATDVLLRGAGTRFHPLAVASLLRLGPAPKEEAVTLSLFREPRRHPQQPRRNSEPDPPDPPARFPG
jgi:hypothetical protein